MSSSETPIHGTVAPGFEAVATAFENNFATQGDVGASVAITIAGVTGRRPVGRHGDVRRTRRRRRRRAGCRGRLAGGHDHQRVVDHQDDGGTVLSDARRPRRTRSLRTDRHLLARVRGRRQGGRSPRATCSATPPGCSGWDEPLTMFDLLDHDKLVRPARRASTVVGAGHTVGLPRDQPGLPARRDRQARRRSHARHVLRRGGRRPARRRLPHRHAARSATRASPG